MEKNKKLFLKNYLSNIRMDVSWAAFTKCPKNWKEIDYIPKYNKFYFICDGEGWLKIGDKEFLPKSGQLFLMPADVLQSYSVINENTFTKYSCHFIATIRATNIFDIINLPYYIDIAEKTLMENLFKDLILNYKSCELTASLRVKSILLQIIAYFIENSCIEQIHLSCSSSIKKLKDIIKYIENNLSESITIDQLANIAHFHPNYFIRFFKKHMGISPMHYINKYRVEKAKNLLIAEDMTIMEVADVTGFHDIYYFSRTFKNSTGFSPTEFRKLHNQCTVF